MSSDALGSLLMNVGSALIALGFVLMFFALILYIFLKKFDNP